MIRLFALLISLISIQLSAQGWLSSFEYCGYDTLVNQTKRQYPKEYSQWEKAYQTMATKSKLQRRGFVTDTTYTLRVVFHVLYNTADENISDALINSQLQVLNEAFGHYHADTADLRNEFKDRAGDIGIRFELATTDPNGNPTNGINRRSTFRTSFGSNRNTVKFSSNGGADAWDPNKYFNIWICDLSSGGFDNLLGFATPPATHPFWTATGSGSYPLNEQGAVLHYKVVGVNNPLANQVNSRPLKGRVGVHEVGHYLGLRHIWGDGTGTTGCTVDDYIDDTPNQRRSSNFTCNKANNTCIDLTDDELDLVENYMDYSGDDCMIMFTAQQKSIMREAVVRYRPGVVSKTETKTRYVRDDFTTLFNLYYNADNKITVDVNDDKLNEYSYKVYNMAGQDMKDLTPLHLTRQVLTLGEPSSGLYILQIIQNATGEILLTKKVQYIK